MPARNPFRPTTGASPPELIGRGPVLDAVTEALGAGAGDPGLVTIFTGPRGVGKTVMLNESGNVALSLGWRVVDLTATPGILIRFDAELNRLLNDDSPRPRRRITGVQVAGLGGMSLQPVAETATDVREKLTRILQPSPGGPTQTGLVLTLDEVHRGVGEELRELGALTQHMVREERPFALLMAGLPDAVSGLLSDEVLTFLRRADRHVLSALDETEVAEAMERTFTEAGRTLTPTQSQRAAEASDGYPYLVQLIGYHVWRHSPGPVVSDDAVERGIAEGVARMRRLVIEPAIQGLSDVDREFLFAMAADDVVSAVSDIAERIGRDSNYVNFYRRRLLDAQVIEQAGRGRLTFSLPYLREYLRDLG
jgi:predicted transcriptional regulator